MKCGKVSCILGLHVSMSVLTPLSLTPSCVTYGHHLQPQRQLPLENRVGVNIGMCGVAGGFSGHRRVKLWRGVIVPLPYLTSPYLPSLTSPYLTLLTLLMDTLGGCNKLYGNKLYGNKL